MVASAPPLFFLIRFRRAFHEVWFRLWQLMPVLFTMTALQAADVTATLSPSSVPAGEGAQLTIKIINGEVTALTAPEVPGLILNGPNQGRQVSIINGVKTSTMTLSYAVGSMTAGEYDIPPFILTVDGGGVQTQAFKLKVTPSAAQAPPGLPPGSSGGGAPSTAAPPGGEQDPGFLTVEFAGKERKHAWVGEIAPVRIKAWLPGESRVSLTTPLQPKGSSFTLHNLSTQPRQDREERNGKSYLVVSWYGGLSATKAGRYPPDLSMTITVQVPDTSAQPQRSRDPIFDRFFARMVSREVELRSKTEESDYLEIRPLPAEGKPQDFAGAVGKFRFGRSNIPALWKTGEPQQIGVEIQGEGNFNLLLQPTLKSDKDWKAYSGQSSFAPGDAASFSGTTSYRFSQVPRQAGSQQVNLTFSYFDPDLASYQTAVTAPLTVEVTGSDLPPEPVATPRNATPNADPPPPALAPQRAREGFTSNLTPLVWRHSFQLYTGGISLALAAGFLTQLLRSKWTNPQRLAKTTSEKALRLAMREAESHAARGDVPGFFAAARRALQVRLGALWHRPATAITLADITRRLPADSPVISFFHEADRQEFCSQHPLPVQELGSWRTHLKQALQAIQPG